jgi:hypothetical protein
MDGYICGVGLIRTQNSVGLRRCSVPLDVVHNAPCSCRLPEGNPHERHAVISNTAPVILTSWASQYACTVQNELPCSQTRCPWWHDSATRQSACERPLQRQLAWLVPFALTSGVHEDTGVWTRAILEILLCRTVRGAKQMTCGPNAPCITIGTHTSSSKLNTHSSNFWILQM